MAGPLHLLAPAVPTWQLTVSKIEYTVLFLCMHIIIWEKYLRFQVMVVFRIKTDWILKRQGATGVEPVTSRSAVECSATELYPQR